MGLFSGKTKVYVSSVVYNMAGDELKRPQYLKTVVIGAVMNPDNSSMGETIVSSYLNGPGLKFRNFGRWARESGYTNNIGQTSGSITVNEVSDTGIVEDAIPNEGKTVILQSAKVDAANYEYWSDQWVLDNHPELIGSQYKTDYDINGNIATITFASGPTYTYIPVGYNPDARYIYGVYVLGSDSTTGPIEQGSLIVLGSEDTFPSTTGWSIVYNNVTPKVANLNVSTHVVITYSDSRPGSDTTTPSTDPTNYNEVDAQWDKNTYIGDFKTERQIYTRWIVEGRTTQVGTPVVTTETITGGVTKTTTTTVTKEILSLVRSYRIDKQVTTSTEISPIKIFIYQEGTGNAALDSLFSSQASINAFLPFIPVRIDNRFISESTFPYQYDMAKKAYKKAMKASYDDLIKKVADNASLGDIDYAYVVYGVSLNVKENACKKYIYKFFDGIRNSGGLSNALDYAAWTLNWDVADSSLTKWSDWVIAQNNPTDPLFGKPEPVRIPYPDMPQNSLTVGSSNNAAMNYNMTIMWNYISESTGVGLLKPNAKVDELWFTTEFTSTYSERILNTNDDGLPNPFLITTVNVVERVVLNWQVTSNTWKKLTIAGLNHRNLIYGGKSVDITALQALADAEESGFIIPLQEQLYRDMSLIDSTQMATACSFIVFNCYQVVKQKWYQTGIFQIIVIIVIIIVSVLTGGAAAGLLGPALEVGVSLGFTGTLAIVVGAVANALAAMVLMSVIQAGAKAVLGDKLGSVLGPILAVVAVVVGSGMINGSNFSASLGNLMRAENILKLTNAVGQGYAGYVQAGVNEIIKDTEDLLSDYGDQSKEISNKFLETFGLRGGVIDPLNLTSSVGLFDQAMEPVNTFLGRTLMTGTDIADMTLKMITEFASMTTSNQLQ